VGFEIPKESFIVGYENPNGTLSTYAFTQTTERYPTYEYALKIARTLGKKWRVYKMKFEEIKK